MIWNDFAQNQQNQNEIESQGVNQNDSLNQEVTSNEGTTNETVQTQSSSNTGVTKPGTGILVSDHRQPATPTKKIIIVPVSKPTEKKQIQTKNTKSEIIVPIKKESVSQKTKMNK